MNTLINRFGIILSKNKKEEWNRIGTEMEQKKEKCNCLCHFKKPPTAEEYAVSSYYGCKHCRKPTKVSDEKEDWEKFFSKEKGQLGRLGAYLNTMVSDLKIDNRGQYLRDLFSKYEGEVKALLQSERERCLKIFELIDKTSGVISFGKKKKETYEQAYQDCSKRFRVREQELVKLERERIVKEEECFCKCADCDMCVKNG